MPASTRVVVVNVVDGAIAEYKEAVRLDPGMSDAWYDLGVLYRQIRDNANAVDAFQHYVALTRDTKVEEDIRALGGTVKKK